MAYPISRCRYPSDVKRIIEIAAKHGVVASALEAETAWLEHSDNACAGWLNLCDDDSAIWANLPSWFTGEDDGNDY